MPRKKKATVATPCPQYVKMTESWALPDALLGSTPAMKAGGRTWLPKDPKESDGAYKVRLERTVLYGAYKRTVQALSGLPFHRAVVVTKAPADLDYLSEDCDSDNSDITDFSHTLTKDLNTYGLSHFLVDNPDVEAEVTLAYKEKYKVRPYFTHISPKNIISWSTELVGGATILRSIRILETVTEDVDEWEVVEVQQIRVITEDSHTLYRQASRDKWEVYGVPLINNLGYIPLVTIYGERTGYMTASVPLEDLAWLNLRHYQKLSDLDNIEHVANVPLLLATGVEEGQLEGITIGPNTLINLSDSSATLKYVEHSGQAITASQKSIDKLEERMASMGADQVIRKSVDRQTATARALDASESVSMLQLFINNVETGIKRGYEIAGDWIDVEAEDVNVSIGSWMDSGAGGPNFIDLLANYLIENEGMPLDEAVKELQRRGSLSDTFELPKGTKLIPEPAPVPAAFAVAGEEEIKPLEEEQPSE